MNKQTSNLNYIFKYYIDYIILMEWPKNIIIIVTIILGFCHIGKTLGSILNQISDTMIHGAYIIH